MDLTLSPQEQAFRDELRAWLEANHPGNEPRGRRRRLRVPQGLAAAAATTPAGPGVSWPKEFGGRGATLIEQAIYGEEMVARPRARAPPTCWGWPWAGRWSSPTAPRSRSAATSGRSSRAEEIWCQGFSEPESGSDLASLKTRAVRDGDEWVVTGQKVWTTLAHQAKWCMLVARTDQDAAKHKGLTYFILDMDQPGVQVRPLVQITGEAEFNELFFEEARDPRTRTSWAARATAGTVAITTLMHERADLAFGLQIQVKIALGELFEEARSRERRQAAEDPVIRQRLAQLYIESEVLRLNALPRAHRDHAQRRPGARRARWASGSGPTSTSR